MEDTPVRPDANVAVDVVHDWVGVLVVVPLTVVLVYVTVQPLDAMPEQKVVFELAFWPIAFQ